MPALSITKSYADGTDLTEDQLDDLKTSIETWANTTKLDQDNIQTGGVSQDNLATNSVSTAKIVASAVTTAKIADDAITNVKMANDSVDTAEIVDAAVTKVKQEAVTVTTDGSDPGAGGVVKSTNSGSGGSGFSTSSTSLTDVTNLSVTLTTTGRPVMLMLESDSTTTATSPFDGIIQVESNNSALVAFLDNTTVISSQMYDNDSAGFIPASAFRYLYDVAAGTHTFKVQTASGIGTYDVLFKSVVLVAYEI